MPSDEFYEKEFEALVPRPPQEAPPQAIDDADDVPGEREYGRVDGGQAVFEPDELFLQACHNKGIADVEGEFACKTEADFLAGLQGKAPDFAHEVASRRLANYDFMRARKMALVLRERERLIREQLSCRDDDGASPCGASPACSHQASSQGASQKYLSGPRVTVASLRKPSLNIPTSQTDALELWKSRLRFTQSRVAKNARAMYFRRKRHEDEGVRQEAAYNELRIRHLVTSVQKRELERMNEGLAAARFKRLEHAQHVRQSMREGWNDAALQKLQTIEGKTSSFEENQKALQAQRTHRVKEQAARREQRLQHAALVRSHADVEREKTLDEKHQQRRHVAERKQEIDTDKTTRLRYRRQLQEAYSKQVVDTSAKMYELRASEIVERTQQRDVKTEALRQDGCQDASWRVEALAAANQLRRDKVQHFRAQLDEEDNERRRSKVENKIRHLEAANESRERMCSLRAEAARLSQERKNDMRRRVYNEQEAMRLSMATSMQEKHMRKDEHLAQLSYIKNNLARVSLSTPPAHQATATS